MILSSNIPDVIKRLRYWQEHLPEAVGRALEPNYWATQLREVARLILQAELAQWGASRKLDAPAAAKVVGQIQQFVDGIRGQRQVAITAIVAAWPQTGIDLPTLVKSNELFQATGQMLLGLDAPALERAKQAVADWVNNEKNLAPGESAEEALDRVQRILGLIPAGSAAAMQGWLDSDKRKLAAEGLSKAIQSWLDQSAKDNPVSVDAATVEQWLSMVLLSWREHVRLHLPERLAAELRRLNRHELI